jgi:pimeloyl-ACP methyl ester carboxylesterase
MTRLTHLGFYAIAAAAWLSCDDAMLTGTTTQGVLTPGPPTSGGQTPYENSDGLSFYEYLPAGYSNGGQFPLLVFLHGIGECGDGSFGQLPRVLKHGPPKLIENGKAFPAIVISPQALGTPTSCSWVNLTTPFIDFLLDRYAGRIDLSRIYITGLSLGGQGTWAYARNHPSTVAAIVPICGPRSGTGYSVLREMPTWPFHNTGDGTVSIGQTISLLQEITGDAPDLPSPPPDANTYTGYFKSTGWEWRAGQSAPGPGENPAFTVYNVNSHDAWTKAYNNQAMWDWLFAQRLPGCSAPVFRQDFQSSTSVGSYVGAPPNNGQFDNISSEAHGGTWSINAGRLQLVRSPTDGADPDNDAGITRWTNLPCTPTKLHITFDLGVSGWTFSPSQTGAMVFAIGAMSGFSDYGNGEVSANTFHSFGVKGEGTGQFSVASGTSKSALLPATGAMQRVAVFLNNSGAAAAYRAPDGSLRTLRNDGVALWVNSAAVIVDGPAANGASSALSDFRIRWGTGVDGTWALDNVAIDRTFPQ